MQMLSQVCECCLKYMKVVSSMWILSQIQRMLSQVEQMLSHIEWMLSQIKGYY